MIRDFLIRFTLHENYDILEKNSSEKSKQQKKIRNGISST